MALKYTAEQQAIAADRSQRLLVNALAGTGKTESIAHRVVALLADGIAADDILVTTFTKTARDQITARLKGHGVNGVRVGTLHAVALDVVARSFAAAGKQSPRPLADGGNRMLTHALREHGLRATELETSFLKRVLAGSASGEHSIPSSITLTHHEIDSVLASYRRRKTAAGRIDFTDVFRFAFRLLDHAPRYGEVIVDEAQDLSFAQKLFAESLSNERLVLVGDRNQSIYSFAGVEDDVLALDPDDYAMLPLTRSFRAGTGILRYADDLIAGNYDDHGNNSGRVFFRRQVANVPQVVAKCVEQGTDVVLARTKRELDVLASGIEQHGFSVDRTYGKRNRGADVQLATIHAAKGNEWDRVVIAGLGSEGFRSTLINDAEERRLLYVAATRAKRRLDVFYLDGLPWEWHKHEAAA